MSNPVIALNVKSNQYAKLVVLGNTVIVGLSGNLNYLSPAISIVNLGIAVTDVANAISAWGVPGNRGSHADLLNLRVKARTLYQLLKAEADYVTTTAIAASPDDFATAAAVMATSGFDLKNDGSPQSTLQQVQDLQFVPSLVMNRNQAKMMWKNPLGVTTPANVKSNIIYRSLTTNFADAVQFAVTTKNEFIVTNDTGSVVTWSFFVAAVGGNAGVGVISNPVTITLLAS